MPSGAANASSPKDRKQFLEALAYRYRAPLVRFFKRRAPTLDTEAEDLTQEVFARLCQRDNRGEITAVEGYVFKAASSVLIDRMRRNASRQTDDHIPYEESDHAIEALTPERVYMAREQVKVVASVVQGLPDRVRAAFLLHRFEDMTYAEIAKRLGVSISSVEKYIMRALDEITARTRGSNE